MIEKGQQRFMRDGTLVTVVEIFPMYDSYWKRHRPYVRLAHPDGEIIRALGTVESYTLAERTRRQHG